MAQIKARSSLEAGAHADSSVAPRNAQTNEIGRLIGIARRARRREPMEETAWGAISLAAGLDGDFKGAKYPRRQITVMTAQAWAAALAEIGTPALAWTARRANLLVEHIELPRAAGGILRIGDVRLEVTAQTYPCRRMDEAFAGLLRALAKDWRGGVTCRVLSAGRISVGDPVEVLVRPPERTMALPI
jgi:MOSC domain-containing protein YiiM